MNKKTRKVSSRLIILKAAKNEFAKYGLAGARVDRIAERGKINKAMIYYHFGSKERLYETVLSEHLDRLASRIRKTIDDMATLEEALVVIAEQYHTYIAHGDNFRNILLFELASGGERLAETFKRLIVRRNIPSHLGRKIGEGIEAGEYRNIDIKQAILAFVGMNLFYLLVSPVTNMILEIDDEESFRSNRPQQLVDLFLNGLRVR